MQLTKELWHSPPHRSTTFYIHTIQTEMAHSFKAGQTNDGIVTNDHGSLHAASLPRYLLILFEPLAIPPLLHSLSLH